jgi:excisionase family DNA binding protein
LEGWAKVKKAAEYAGVSERTFRSWLKNGLKHTRLPGGTVLTKYDSIDEYLERFEVNENLVDEIVDSVVSDLLTTNNNNYSEGHYGEFRD